MHVGNGGAGPGYGLERFGYVSSRSLIPRATPKEEVIKIVHDARGREVSRSDLFDEKGQKVDWLDVSFFDTMTELAGDGRYGPKAPSRPFPLDGPLDDDEDRIGETCPADGVWTLAEYGCGILANLVLNGPFRGQVWIFDPNESCYEPFAERTYLHDEQCDVVRDKNDDLVFTFFEWYEHWLDYAVLQVQAEYRAAKGQ